MASTLASLLYWKVHGNMETFLYIPLRYKSSMTSKTLFKGTLSRAMNKLINAFSTTENIIKYGGFFFVIYQNSRRIYPFGFFKA